jgi:hypothetical protein
MIPLQMQTAPEKPAKGEPCNGCGFCCAAEVCRVGTALHGENVEAPCPSMEFRDGRFWCGAVRLADEMGMGDILRFHMGIGMGCDSDDFEEQP